MSTNIDTIIDIGEIFAVSAKKQQRAMYDGAAGKRNLKQEGKL
jgi:hypothetical protein